MTAPCKDCTFRHLGCHATCASYLDWKQRRQVAKDKEAEDRKCDYDAMKRWRYKK